MRLKTKRLIVRSFEERDSEPWLSMVTDPDFRRFLPPGPIPTAETFKSAIQRRRELERDLGYTMWAIDAKDSGLFVGQCGLRPINEAGPEIDLAYHFNKASWGKGYATEAVVAVLAHAFRSLGVDRVIAVVMPENVGSWRVAEKSGMRYEGSANYYGLTGVKKYVADRDWWSPPPAS